MYEADECLHVCRMQTILIILQCICFILSFNFLKYKNEFNIKLLSISYSFIEFNYFNFNIYIEVQLEPDRQSFNEI